MWAKFFHTTGKIILKKIFLCSTGQDIMRYVAAFTADFNNRFHFNIKVFDGYIESKNFSLSNMSLLFLFKL